jgi:hypothetical protein
VHQLDQRKIEKPVSAVRSIASSNAEVVERLRIEAAGFRTMSRAPKRPHKRQPDSREDQNVILPTNWMLRGWVTVPFHEPKLALEGSLLNGMQSPKAWPSHVK